MKIKWKVIAAPTGRYRSFEKRGWPVAYYEHENGAICAMISCENEYIPANVKIGNHTELTLRIADYSQEGCTFRWVRAKRKFATLQSLKIGLLEILKANPNLMPKQ